MRREQPVQPLMHTFIRPLDNQLTDEIYCVTKNNGKSMITRYVSTEKLSFETIRMIRKDMGLPEIKNQEDLDREMSQILELQIG
jgi:hypothetical protein